MAEPGRIRETRGRRTSGGRLVKSLGDGMLLDFDDVRSAVSAAFAIQHASNRSNVGLPPEKQILLRMGMEVSDVIVEPNDLHGRGVNLAARLMALAGPGEIVISAARARPAHAVPRRRRRGSRRLLCPPYQPAGARLPHRPARPAAGGEGGRTDWRPRARRSRSCLLRPATARPDQRVIGEAIAEEVIRALSRSADLSVISRLSTTAFRGREVTFSEISAHLNADYVLSGVYRSDDQHITLDAELAEAKSGRILWTERLTDQVSGLLDGDHGLIGRLVAEVSNAVVTRELQRSKLQPLPTLRSYTLLMGAIALMHRLSLRDFEEARQLLQTLIDRGIRQPIPHAWLANWHVLRVQQGWSVDERQDAYLALESTKRALDIDPDCSLALAVDGFVHTNLLKKLDVAQERYDQAIAAPTRAIRSPGF